VKCHRIISVRCRALFFSIYNSIENTERHAERFKLCFSERKILFQSEKKKGNILKQYICRGTCPL